MAIVIIGAFTAYQAIQARSALLEAAGLARQIPDHLRSGDIEQASSVAERLSAEADTAHSSTSGPVWWLLAHTPFIGSDVDAVRTISASLDVITTDALPQIISTADGLDADDIAPDAGAIDLDYLDKLAPAAKTAADVLGAQRARLSSVDPAELSSSIAPQVEQLQDQLDRASSYATTAAEATDLLPELLRDGTYLLVFQNNAEIRSTGGIPGAYALMTADDGKVTLTPAVAGNSVPVSEYREGTFDPTTEALFGTIPAQNFLSTNVLPDFADTAPLWADRAGAQANQQIDGVISMDPIAAARALRATGPIQMSDGTTLTSDNAVDSLLRDTYRRFDDPKAQDAYFREAMQRASTEILNGSADIAALTSALSSAVNDHRILMWLRDNAQQATIAGQTIAGDVDQSDDRPRLGFYVNSTNQAKLQYYLDYETTVTPGRCTEDGKQQALVTTTLTSNVPADVDSLPDYVTGTVEKGLPKGVQVLTTYLLAPKGGSIDGIQLDGEIITPSNTGDYHDRPAANVVLNIKPGQTVKLAWIATSGTDQTGEMVLDQTPGVRTTGTHQVISTLCSGSDS